MTLTQHANSHDSRHQACPCGHGSHAESGPLFSRSHKDDEQGKEPQAYPGSDLQNIHGPKYAGGLVNSIGGL